MEVKDQIRQQVRDQIKKQVNIKNEDGNVKESILGSTFRGLGSVGGTIAGAGSLVAGGAVSALTLSVIPVFVGAAGIFAAIAGMRMLHSLADKMDDRELLSQSRTLSDLVEQRDELLVKMDNLPDETEKERLQSDVERLTRQMKRLGRKMKNSIRDRPELRENLTKRQLDQIDSAVEAAEQGALTNLEEE